MHTVVTLFIIIHITSALTPKVPRVPVFLPWCWHMLILKNQRYPAQNNTHQVLERDFSFIEFCLCHSYTFYCNYCTSYCLPTYLDRSVRIYNYLKSFSSPSRESPGSASWSAGELSSTEPSRRHSPEILKKNLLWDISDRLLSRDHQFWYDNWQCT